MRSSIEGSALFLWIDLSGGNLVDALTRFLGGTMRRYIGRITCKLSLAITLAACATAGQQFYWVNPQIEEQLQQARFTLDSTECTGTANQLVPEPGPDARAPTAVQAGYERAQREQQRREYVTACLMNRGWEQRMLPNGR